MSDPFRPRRWVGSWRPGSVNAQKRLKEPGALQCGRGSRGERTAASRRCTCRRPGPVTTLGARVSADVATSAATISSRGGQLRVSATFDEYRKIFLEGKPLQGDVQIARLTCDDNGVGATVYADAAATAYAWTAQAAGDTATGPATLPTPLTWPNLPGARPLMRRSARPALTRLPMRRADAAASRYAWTTHPLVNGHAVVHRDHLCAKTVTCGATAPSACPFGTRVRVRARQTVVLVAPGSRRLLNNAHSEQLTAL